MNSPALSIREDVAGPVETELERKVRTGGGIITNADYIAHNAATRTAEARHDRIMRGRQMGAIARWPVADQIALLRQIATDINKTPDFGRTARHEALIVMDQADELERLLVMGGRS